MAEGVTLARLRKFIAERALPLNSRLPAERRLCDDLAVSRSALRKALAHLEAEGQIWRHVGRGTFVGSRPVENGNDVAHVSSRTSPGGLMDARLLIEPGMARLAAARATNADIDEMGRCILKTRSAADWRAYETWDNYLHHAFAVAAHNVPLLSMFDTLNMVRRSVVWGRRRNRPLTGNLDHHSFAEHDAILAAIVERDPERAEAAMRAHLISVRRDLLAALDGMG